MTRLITAIVVFVVAAAAGYLGYNEFFATSDPAPVVEEAVEQTVEE